MKKIVLLTIILFLSSPLCAHAIGVLAADGETCYLVVNPTGFNKTCVDTSTRASEALKGDTRLQTTENFRPNFYARPSINGMVLPGIKLVLFLKLSWIQQQDTAQNLFTIPTTLGSILLVLLLLSPLNLLKIFVNLMTLVPIKQAHQLGGN
jgi:hypothetical protein